MSHQLLEIRLQRMVTSSKIRLPRAAKGSERSFPPGVMATQQVLVLSFQVRVLGGDFFHLSHSVGLHNAAATNRKRGRFSKIRPPALDLLTMPVWEFSQPRTDFRRGRFDEL